MGKYNNGASTSREARSNIAVEKAKVRSRLRSGEYCTSERAGSSPACAHFDDIKDKATNEYVQFVCCKKCSEIFSLKPGSATTHLLRHIQKCEAPQEEEDNILHPKKLTGKKRKLLDAKNSMTEKLVEMCGRDLAPFNIVKKPGFRAVLQEGINIGAEIGKIEVGQILPAPSTISRNVSNVADKVRLQFLPQVKAALAKGQCAFDTDLWTDKYTKTHYLTVTAQYINEELELKSNVLFTTEFPTNESKTGENIKKHIVENLAELGISLEDFESAIFITDEGSNIKLALSDFERYACVAHLLATVLRHLLDEDKFLKLKCPMTLAALQSCRKVVNYLKKTGCCKILDNSVKLLITTRWNTVVDMLESVCSTFDKIVQVLTEKKAMAMLGGWDGELITELVTFLTPFRDFTREIQAKKVPTMHLVLVRFQQLLDHCEVDLKDGVELKLIKLQATSLLLDKVKMTDIHYVAAFLCPNLRLLKGLSEEERKRAHQVVREKLKNFDKGTDTRNNSAPAPKKSRFGSWGQTSQDLEAQKTIAVDEVDVYISLGHCDDEDPSSLLPWWKSKAAIFPNLARLAQQFLAVPATSASSERNFSRAGLLLSEKRTQMGPHQVNDLLVIHNNYEKQDEIDKGYDADSASCDCSLQHSAQAAGE